MIKVGVAYGTIDRLADGVARQEDMELVGVADLPDISHSCIERKGHAYDLYLVAGADKEKFDALDTPQQEHLRISAIKLTSADSSPGGIGAKNKGSASVRCQSCLPRWREK